MNFHGAPQELKTLPFSTEVTIFQSKVTCYLEDTCKFRENIEEEQPLNNLIYLEERIICPLKCSEDKIKVKFLKKKKRPYLSGVPGVP